MKWDKKTFCVVGVGMVIVFGCFLGYRVLGKGEAGKLVKGVEEQESLEVQETLEVQENLETQGTSEKQESTEQERGDLIGYNVEDEIDVDGAGRESTTEPEEGRQEEEIKAYLSENVPELEAYKEYIREVSEQQAHLTIRVYMDLESIGQNEQQKYYAVYVGEAWEDHSVNWDWFYVREDLEEILWYSIVEDIYLSLDEWRESEYIHLQEVGRMK